MRIQGYPNPGDGLRLHLNENTGGCSPRVLEAIRRVRADDVSTYPEYTQVVLAVARHFDVDPEWVLLTNGLDEGILMAAVGHIARARLHDAETIIPLPAFDPYPNSTAAVGATAVRVPATPTYAFQADAVLAAITPRTKLIFLNTPNNPTGQLIRLQDLKRIAAAATDAVVLIDEAYIEFGGVSFLPELRKYPNVLVGRTFSKAYGLAGMRVGIVIGQPAALDPVRAVTLPFNINGVALAAVHAALEDTLFLPRYAVQVRDSQGTAVCGVPPARPRVLGERRELRDDPRRRDGAVRTGHGGAPGARPRPRQGPGDAGMHPRDGGHPRAHRCRDRGARVGDGREAGAMSRRARAAAFDRQTTETQIKGKLTIDGHGRYDVSTGIRFFDHMLELFTRHGGFDLTLHATGDLDVDQHHTVEDVGIVLGEALLQALGDRKGINRAGYFLMPMDETLGLAAVDLSGRPHAVVDLKVKVRMVGDLQSELVHDFFDGFATGARANVHAKVLYGRSSHHHIEAVFKAFARALRVACARDARLARMLPSTKGLL